MNIDKELARCVNIEPLILNEEFVRLPSDLAYWNGQYSEALKTYLTTKLQLKRLEAQLQMEKRVELETQNKKVTESMVEAAIEIDDRHHAAQLALIESECEKEKLDGFCEALRTKKEMLISLGASLRAEMNGDPMLRNHMRDQRDNSGM